MAYETANDGYVDKGSGVLLNKLGITSEDELLEAEAEITAVESSAILFESDLSKIKFNSQLLRMINEQLFHRIYEWAGEYRNIDLQKGDTYFAHAPHISSQLEALLAGLANENYLENLNKQQFTERLTFYYSELNVIHPFREGNGRSIRLFLSLLAYKGGWSIAWDSMGMEANIKACEAAYLGDESLMAAMLMPLIEPTRP